MNPAVVEHSVDTFLCFQLFLKGIGSIGIYLGDGTGEYSAIVPSLFFSQEFSAESQLERAAFSSHWKQLKASGEG